MVGLSLVTFLVAVMSYITISQLNEIAKPLNKDIPEDIHVIAETTRLDALVNLIRYYDEVLTQSARNYAFTEDKNWERRYHDIEPQLGNIIKQAIAGVGQSGKKFFADVNKANIALVEMEHAAMELVDAGEAEEAIKILEGETYWKNRTFYIDGLNAYVNSMDLRRDKALVASDLTLKAAIVDVQNLIQHSKYRIFYIVLLFSMSVLGVSVFVFRTITNPIRDLRKGIEIIGGGNLDYKVGTDSKDEIGQLSRAFDQMVNNLKGSMTSINALNKEISERKKAESEIKKAAQEWQRTFDSITDLVFIQDSEYTIAKVNKAFAKAMKVKPEEIIGKKCHEVVHGRNTPWPGCPFQNVLDSKKGYSEEVDGQNIGTPLLVTVSPIFDETGKLVGAVHVAKDITERRKVENLKNEFVSMVSHELRTPLSIIKEGVSLVLDEIPGKVNEKQRDILNMSSENIGRLARIIDNLLDISKIEAGKLKLKKTLVDLSQIVKIACEEWRLKSSKKAQDLRCSIPDKPISISVDPDKIIQVLDNLISNAVKYTPEKGRIRIKLTDSKDNVKISISDTGRGISKKDLPKVFDKFQQFGRTSGPGANGTGLGLAITKNLVREHGGTIKVESKVNKGSKFTVVFPKGE